MRGLRGKISIAALLVATACGGPPGDSDSPGDGTDQITSPTPGGGDTAETPTPQPTASPRPVSDSPEVVVGPQSVAGWWDGSRWVRADGTAPIPVEGGESYKLIGLTSGVEQATGSEVMEGCEPVPGSSKIEIDGLQGSFTDPLEETRIAVSGVADPLPREAAQLPPSAVYVEAARSLLAERGMQVETPNVLQLVRVDLDGDGRNEVVVVAERIADQQSLIARPGDYSIVFVRSVVDEQVVTSVLADTLAEDEPGVAPFVQSHRVSAAADLNGDGRMELAVAGKYYEGAGVVFYEFGSDGRMKEILASGCGS